MHREVHVRINVSCHVYIMAKGAEEAIAEHDKAQYMKTSPGTDSLLHG